MLDKPNFNPSGLGLEIFQDRYTINPEETYEQAALRLSSFVSTQESNSKYWSAAFNEIIRTGAFMPGGRIWYGCGRPVSQLLNCFVIPTEDSREGWARMVGQNIIISGTGGGLGENYSNIRYRGAKINGTGGVASGAVSIMKIENAALEEIRSGSSRRAARMFALNINHPDIMEFVHAKMDLGQLNNGNASVIFDFDPLTFFDKVDKNENLDLIFQGTIRSTIPAQEIWQKILQHSLSNGEPGVLNGFRANEDSNIAYCRTLICTNPCGEQWLHAYSSCCLGALVLPRFIKTSKSKNFRDKIDWEFLHHTVSVAVRFLDNVLSVSYYPLPEIKQEALDTRRVGMGVMGVHYMLIKLGLKYSSQEGRDACSKISEFIKHAAYDTSINLSSEKGPFPLWDAQKAFTRGNFIGRMKPSMKSKIKLLGLRNCSLLTIAPTGTTGMVQGVSTGIEPIFASAYNRRFYKDGEKTQSLVVDSLFKEMVLADQDVSCFESASDIAPEDHLRMQLAWQEHIDNAVSKTINIPQDLYTIERMDALYREFLPKLKGMTVYPEGSRPDAPLERLPLEEALALVRIQDVEEAISDDCRTGNCVL
jgi:ribonucleoside-diphosphate reductase alpha chain